MGSVTAAKNEAWKVPELKILLESYWRGDTKESDRSLSKIEEMAESGHIVAALWLGSICITADDGDFEKYNDANACKWLKIAAEKGHSNAQYLLGMLYSQSSEIKKDPWQAEQWYKKAAENGDSDAQHILELYTRI